MKKILERKIHKIYNLNKILLKLDSCFLGSFVVVSYLSSWGLVSEVVIKVVDSAEYFFHYLKYSTD